MKLKISIIGLGIVGSAMYKSFSAKNTTNTNIIYGYDKYKSGGIGTIELCCDSDIIFLALPTEYDQNLKEYNKLNIYSVLDELNNYNYKKCIVIKSTVEPKTTEIFQDKYPNMNFVHNPEFLTTRTAFDDFHNQKHIVLGKTKKCSEEQYNSVIELYREFYPDSVQSLCTSTESESMKIYCNSFYAVKIQFFNELYLLSQSIGTNYDTIVQLMLKNNWINSMHTNVPGPDGKLSYGGACFPKDTNALLQVMKNNGSAHKVLEACINERNEIRNNMS
jgi:UDPglucose 6-dehydrogenase